MKADLTPRLLDALGLRSGRRVLELGAGTGELAARLAAAVAPGGSVVASDVAPGMVGLLKARLDGIAGVEVAEIDATDIALPTSSVDAVAFRMGLMLVPQPAAAVAEIERVLRPDGRVAARGLGRSAAQSVAHDARHGRHDARRGAGRTADRARRAVLARRPGRCSPACSSRFADVRGRGDRRRRCVRGRGRVPRHGRRPGSAAGRGTARGAIRPTSPGCVPPRPRPSNGSARRTDCGSRHRRCC